MANPNRPWSMYPDGFISPNPYTIEQTEHPADGSYSPAGSWEDGWKAIEEADFPYEGWERYYSPPTKSDLDRNEILDQQASDAMARAVESSVEEASLQQAQTASDVHQPITASADEQTELPVDPSTVNTDVEGNELPHLEPSEAADDDDSDFCGVDMSLPEAQTEVEGTESPRPVPSETADDDDADFCGVDMSLPDAPETGSPIVPATGEFTEIPDTSAVAFPEADIVMSTSPATVDEQRMHADHVSGTDDELITEKKPNTPAHTHPEGSVEPSAEMNAAMPPTPQTKPSTASPDVVEDTVEVPNDVFSPNSNEGIWTEKKASPEKEPGIANEEQPQEFTSILDEQNATVAAEASLTDWPIDLSARDNVNSLNHASSTASSTNTSPRASSFRSETPIRRFRRAVWDTVREASLESVSPNPNPPGSDIDYFSDDVSLVGSPEPTSENRRASEGYGHEGIDSLSLLADIALQEGNGGSAIAETSVSNPPELQQQTNPPQPLSAQLEEAAGAHPGLANEDGDAEMEEDHQNTNTVTPARENEWLPSLDSGSQLTGPNILDREPDEVKAEESHDGAVVATSSNEDRSNAGSPLPMSDVSSDLSDVPNFVEPSPTKLSGTSAGFGDPTVPGVENDNSVGQAERKPIIQGIIPAPEEQIVSASPSAASMTFNSAPIPKPKSNSQVKRQRQSRPKNPSSNAKNDKSFKPDGSESSSTDKPPPKKAKTTKAASAGGNKKSTTTSGSKKPEPKKRATTKSGPKPELALAKRFKKNGGRKRAALDGAEGEEAVDQVVTVGDISVYEDEDEEINEDEQDEQDEKKDEDQTSTSDNEEPEPPSNDEDNDEENNSDKENNDEGNRDQENNDEGNNDEENNDEDHDDKENAEATSTPDPPRRTTATKSPKEKGGSVESTTRAAISLPVENPPVQHQGNAQDITFPPPPPPSNSPRHESLPFRAQRSLTPSDLEPKYGKRTTRSETKNTTPMPTPQPSVIIPVQPTQGVKGKADDKKKGKSNTKGTAKTTTTDGRAKSAIPAKRKAAGNANAAGGQKKDASPAVADEDVPRKRTRASLAAEEKANGGEGRNLRNRKV